MASEICLFRKPPVRLAFLESDDIALNIVTFGRPYKLQLHSQGLGPFQNFRVTTCFAFSGPKESIQLTSPEG